MVGRKQLTADLRVDIHFETPLVFALEVLSLVVRFKNTNPALGTLATGRSSNGAPLPSVLETELGEADAGPLDPDPHSAPDAPPAPAPLGWLTLRLSTSLSSAKRLLLTQELVQPPTPQLSLLLGYIQLVGTLELDEQIMDPEPFAASRPLLHAAGELSPSFFAPTEPLVFPVLTTPQALLFTNLSLAPGESRSFHYLTSLPRNAPPSYSGSAVQVGYHVIVGTQDVGLCASTLSFPVRVHPFIDRWANQPRFTLMEPIVTQVPGHVTELAGGRVSFRALRRGSQRLSISRRASATSLYSAEPHHGEIENGESHVTAVEKPSSGEPPLPHAAGLATFLSQLVIGPDRPRRHLVPESLTCRESLFVLMNEQGLERVEVEGLHSQLGRSQRRFKVSCKGVPVATVTLARPVVKLGDDIQLSVEFEEGTEAPATGLTVSLVRVEDIPSRLLADPVAEPHGTQRKRDVVDTVVANVMDCEECTAVVNVPATATAQFQSDVVTVSWKVEVEFVLATAIRYKEGRTDLNGVLWVEGGDLAGSKVLVALPVAVVP